MLFARSVGIKNSPSLLIRLTHFCVRRLNRHCDFSERGAKWIGIPFRYVTTFFISSYILPNTPGISRRIRPDESGILFVMQIVSANLGRVESIERYYRNETGGVCVTLSFQPLGDTGIRIQFGNAIDPEINRHIRSYCQSLEKESIPGVIEWVPSYCAITIYYNPYIIQYHTLLQRLEKIAQQLQDLSTSPAEVVILPVLYGGEWGPDLLSVAQKNGLSTEEVVQLHSKPHYLTYMMGFLPGFPYLGGMTDKIATPRLEVPRQRVPSGSVGIAGSQTGVYPLESPGGWRIIGRTPVRLYDPHREVPILLKTGNYIQFRPIDEEEYKEIEEKESQGQYVANKKLLKGDGSIA